MPLPKMTRDKNVMIYKYPLALVDEQHVEMPAGADVLCVQIQDGRPCIWAKVDVRSTPTARLFYVVGTGHPMPVKAQEYVGTFQMQDGALVFHVFEG